MYNNELAEVLIKKFGDESFKIYCIMEAEKNKLLSDSMKKKQEVNEYDYEATWWEQKYKDLLEKENH